MLHQSDPTQEAIIYYLPSNIVFGAHMSKGTPTTPDCRGSTTHKFSNQGNGQLCLLKLTIQLGRCSQYKKSELSSEYSQTADVFSILLC